jgi:hypothetical protein
LLERVILWAEIGWDKSKIDKRQRVNGMKTLKIAVLAVTIYMDYKFIYMLIKDWFIL